jgi:adenine-specific DNA-methyltransferase
VCVTSSTGPEDAQTSRVVDYDQVVRPDDPQFFIRIPTDEFADQVSERMALCRTTLADLGLTVSTGRVVDFRAKAFLRKEAGKDTVPLIYPIHFECGHVSWPRDGKKPNAIVDTEATRDVLVPNEHYVLTRRFSAKEERRRIVAVVYDARRLRCRAVGFENHLNYFHHNGRGLDLRLARGLAAFLNSTIVDQYFRQFSGHTQVNATDLRNMRYPIREQLERLGSQVGDSFPDQKDMDALIDRELFGAVTRDDTSPECRPA